MTNTLPIHILAKILLIGILSVSFVARASTDD